MRSSSSASASSLKWRSISLLVISGSTDYSRIRMAAFTSLFIYDLIFYRIWCLSFLRRSSSYSFLGLRDTVWSRLVHYSVARKFDGVIRFLLMKSYDLATSRIADLCFRFFSFSSSVAFNLASMSCLDFWIIFVIILYDPEREGPRMTCISARSRFASSLAFF